MSSGQTSPPAGGGADYDYERACTESVMRVDSPPPHSPPLLPTLLPSPPPHATPHPSPLLPTPLPSSLWQVLTGRPLKAGDKVTT